jgi:ribosomal protein S11
MLINSKTNRKANLIAVANILSTSNNILINISDLNNKTIYFGSSGLLGIKGSRRST